MNEIGGMFGSHPKAGTIDTDLYAATVSELSQCDLTCSVCADACLSESHVQMLARCIELNLNCAESCATTARTIARFGFQQPSVTRAHLEACREACRACADECERHQDMEHCRRCAAMCRSCEQTCTTMLESMMTAA
jgi:hypothetical protein